MKIYLAGPMRGVPESNFPMFDRAAERLREQGYEVFSPADHDRESDNLPGPEFSIRKALAADTGWICRHADAIALLPGWENSRGAKAELALAEALGITVIILGEEYTND
jgi:nucleoside 2-deoxyribosyltransferase